MSVAFTVPGSQAIPANRDDSVVWARHRLLGGRLARAWGAYEVGGEQFCWVIRHGSGCDPRQDVDALAGALADDHLTTVVLTPGVDYTSQQVAEAIEAAIEADFSHTATVDSHTVDGVTRYRVTVANSSSAGIVGGAAADGGARGTCGMHECRRSGVGTVTGTLYVHVTVAARLRDGTSVAAGTRCRITGVGYFGDSDFRGRLGVGLGGVHANPPGTITGVVDAGRVGVGDGAVNSYTPIVLPLPTAIPCVIGDDAWILVRDDGTSGNLAYRAHAETGWFGDLSNTENLLLDGADDDPTEAFTASETPSISNNYAVCSAVFLVVEVDDPVADDGSGFPGDGSLWVEYGCQRDGAGETPTEDAPDDETFHYRFRAPPLPRVAVHGVAYSLAVIDADDDMSAAVYSWPDLDNPPATAPVLLGETGLLGFDTGVADDYNVATFTPIPIGNDVVSDPYVSIGYTGGQIAGGAPTLQIQFDTMGAAGSDFGPDGERLYNQGQSPDGWPSDSVVGGLRDLAEFVSQPTSTMPYNAPASAWPDPYDLAGIDIRPGNLGREYRIIREQSLTADVVAVATTADTAAVTFGPSLELSPAAPLLQYVAAWSHGPALELTTAAPLAQVAAAATFGPDLRLRLGRPLGGVPWSEESEANMATLMDLVRGAAASPAATATRIDLSGAGDSQAITAAPASGRGAMVVGGAVVPDESCTLELWSGEPDGVASTLLVETAAAAGLPLPLAVFALYSATAGDALYLRVVEAVVVRGRAVSVET